MYINFVMRLNNKMGLKYKISALILDRQYQRMYQHVIKVSNIPSYIWIHAAYR